MPPLPPLLCPPLPLPLPPALPPVTLHAARGRSQKRAHRLVQVQNVKDPNPGRLGNGKLIHQTLRPPPPVSRAPAARVENPAEELALDSLERLAQLPQSQVDYMRSKIPMGRLGEVSESAAMVCFMASEECSFTTASTFDTSGGRTTF